MVTGNAADFFNLYLCDWLFVCNNGECLQKYICEHMFFRLFCDPYQILVHFAFGTHLIGTIELDDLHTNARLLIFFHEILYNFLCLFFI